MTSGLKIVTPTSVTLNGGSATIGTNGSVLFSGTSAVGINGVFSSEYKNYLVVGYVTATAASIDLRARLMAGGVVNSDTMTNQAAIYYSSVETTIQNNYSYFSATEIGASFPSGFVMNVYQPYLSAPTPFSTTTASAYDGLAVWDVSACHPTGTSFDGINLYVSAGAISGRFSIYGLVS